MHREVSVAKVRRIWDAIASRYDQEMSFFERVFVRDGREWVCSRAIGQVLEVAVGSGRNLPFYPELTTVTGVDVSPAMLDLAGRRAAALGREVELREADAHVLPFPAGSFDTVVCTLSLCAVADPVAALVEMSRVLRGGGRLLLLDHIGSNWWPVWAGQRLAELITVPVAGEHLTRRPARLLRRAGFSPVESQRHRFGLIERVAARNLPEERPTSGVRSIRSAR